MTGRQIKAKRWFQAIGIVALVSVPVFLFKIVPNQVSKVMAQRWMMR